jgi:mRNA deadenylase 3'-5' endonuclease subunit Ccr4
MTRRLEFLKFLTKGALCKTLKNAQINVLWECLVVNAFNEDERDQFFVFCTEILNSVQAHQFKLEQRARSKSN